MRILSLATIILMVFPTPVVIAQDTPPVTEINFTDDEALRISADKCWFVPGQVRDLFDSADAYREIAAELREAEAPIRRYIEDSLDRQQDAVGTAFRDFAAWHRHRVAEDNARRMAEAKMAEIAGQGMDMALNSLFPGSGILNRALRTAGSTVYEQITSNSGGTASPEGLIDQIRGEIEDSEALRRALSDAIFNTVDNQGVRDRIEAIKFEYVMERHLARRQASQVMTEMRPDTCSGQMLHDLGFQRPTVNYFTRVRHSVLAELMYRTLCEQNANNGAGLNCSHYPGRFRAIAKGGATRLILVGRGHVSSMWELTKPEHLSVVCPDYYEFGLFSGPSPDCRNWRQAQRAQ